MHHHDANSTEVRLSLAGYHPCILELNGDPKNVHVFEQNDRITPRITLVRIDNHCLNFVRRYSFLEAYEGDADPSPELLAAITQRREIRLGNVTDTALEEARVS